MKGVSIFVIVARLQALWLVGCRVQGVKTRFLRLGYEADLTVGLQFEIHVLECKNLSLDFETARQRLSRFGVRAPLAVILWQDGRVAILRDVSMSFKKGELRVSTH